MHLQALLASWPFEPSILAGIAATGLLYWLGLRYARAHGMARYHRWWHSLAFAGGLLTLLIALESPLDTWADQLFWAHMVQHELLILVAAPLLLLGAPAMLFWRAVPLGARRATLRWGFRRGWPLRALEWLAHALTTPRVAWVVFLAVFLGWHVPALYVWATSRKRCTWDWARSS
jgi:cytochrome c oxidase assembly factor CtaG